MGASAGWFAAGIIVGWISVGVFYAAVSLWDTWSDDPRHGPRRKED